MGALMDLRVWSLDPERKLHLPGSALCDTETICGATWDDGVYRPVTAAAPTCAGCLDVADVVFEATNTPAPAWLETWRKRSSGNRRGRP